MRIDPERTEFSGSVDIDIEASKPVEAIWLHADRLNIGKAELVHGESRMPLTVAAGSNSLIALRLASNAPVGNNTLHLEYDGQFGKPGDGVFHQKEGGDWYVYTHFEPGFARTMLPCFDEPKFSVPFEVTLQVKDKDEAVSNGAEVSRKPVGDGFKEVRFAATKPIPTTFWRSPWVHSISSMAARRDATTPHSAI